MTLQQILGFHQVLECLGENTNLEFYDGFTEQNKVYFYIVMMSISISTIESILAISA